MQASVNRVVLFRVRLRLYNRHFNYFNFFRKQKSHPFRGFFVLSFLFCFKEVKGIFVFNSDGDQQGLPCECIQGMYHSRRHSS